MPQKNQVVDCVKDKVLDDVPSPDLTVATIVQPSSCGIFDGEVTLVSDGLGVLEYGIVGQGVSLDPVFTNLASGDYTFFVTTQNTVTPDLCSSTFFVSLAAPVVPRPVITSVPPSFCGATDGWVTVTPDVQQEPESTVEYRLRLPTNDWTDWQINNNFAELASGNYTVELRLNGSSDCSERLSFSLVGVGAPVLMADLVRPSSCGVTDGSVNLRVSGGGDFEYRYGIDGEWTNSSLFTGLAGGLEHQFYVRTIGANDNSCLGITSVLIANGPSANYNIEPTLPSDCGANDASVVVSVPSEEIWGASEYRLYRIGESPSSWGSDPVFAEIGAGNYVLETRSGGSDNCIQNFAIALVTEEVPSVNILTATPPTYCGNNDGTVELATETSGNYLFSLIGGGVNDEQASGLFEQLTSGSYAFLVRAADTALFQAGCQSMVNVTLENPEPVGFDFSVASPTNCAMADGNILAIPEQAGVPLQFELSVNGEPLRTSTSGSFTDVGSGAYELTLYTGQNAGCLQTQLIEVISEAGPPFSVVEAAGPEFCGGDNGQLLLVVEAADVELSYRLTGPEGETSENQPLFTGLVAGDYEVTVAATSAQNCFTTQTYTLPEGAIVDFSVMMNPASGCGFSDATLSVIPDQEGLPLLYTLYDSSGLELVTNDSGIFTNLIAGVYRVTQASFGLAQCTAEQTVSVTALGAPLVEFDANQSVSPSQCGRADGTIRLVNVDEGDYQYALSAAGPFTNQPEFNGLSAGNYVVFVRRAGTTSEECLTTIALSLTAPDLPLPTAEVVLANPFCVLQDALIQAVPLNSVVYPEVEYRLTEPGGSQSEWTSETAFADLNSGNYVLTMRINGADQCTSATTVEVGAGNEALAPLPVPVVRNGNDCAGYTAGLFLLPPATDTNTIYYALDGADTWLPLDSIIGLPNGTYAIRAALSNSGCGVSDLVNVTIQEEHGLSATAPTWQNPTACRTEDGTIDWSVLTSVNGTTELTYRLSSEAAWENEPNFTALGPGTYYPEIRSLNADTTCILQLDSVLLTAADLPIFGGVTTLNRDRCTGDPATISISATVPDGSPLSYSIDGMLWQPSPVFTDVAVGEYQLLVRTLSADSLECSVLFPQTVTIDSVSVVALPALELALIRPADCGQENGYFEVQIASNPDHYLFSIDGGADWTSTPQFDSLGNGTYQLSVWDTTAACVFENQTQVVLFDDTQPSIAAVTVEELTDCNAEDARIAVVANQPTLTTEYSIDGGQTWSNNPQFNGLGAGNYLAQLRDTVSGCTFAWNTPLRIDSLSGPVIANILTQPVSDCGSSDGSVSLVLADGSTAYSGTLVGPVTQFSLNGPWNQLPSGTYQLIIGDQDGRCLDTLTSPIVITGPAEITVDSVVVTPLSDCNGADAQLLFFPARMDWQYSIDGGTTWSNQPIFPNLGGGIYQPVARTTAFPGCRDSLAEVELSGALSLPSELAVEWTSTTPCAATLTGVITVTNGTNALRYSLDGGLNWQTDSVFTGLVGEGSTFALTIGSVNDESCLFSDWTSLVSPASAAVALLLDSIAQPDCASNSGGFLSISAAGQTDGVSYAWNDGATTDQRSDLAAGTYTVTLTNAEGCQDSLRLELESDLAAPDPGLDFLLPTQAVINTTVRIIDISPAGNLTNWTFDSDDAMELRRRDRSLFLEFTRLGVTEIGLVDGSVARCAAQLTKQIEIVASVEELDVRPQIGDGTTFLDFTVYPNPATDQAWLEASLLTPASLNISLLNGQGEPLWTMDTPVSTDHIVILPINDLPAGAYPLIVSTGLAYRYVYFIKL